MTHLCNINGDKVGHLWKVLAQFAEQGKCFPLSSTSPLSSSPSPDQGWPMAMNGSHDYVILMLMIIMLMIRRSTWSRLAMNGGHVHEPKFSTRGRPALQRCNQNDSKHDNHYDQDGQDELICDHGHNKRKKFYECDNMRFVMQTWPKRWEAALLLFPSRSTLDLEPTGQPGHHYHHHHHHQPRHHHHHR